MLRSISRLLYASILLPGLTGCGRPSDPARDVATSVGVSEQDPVAPANPQTATFGQTLYVPVYSHVSVGDSRQPFGLAITLTFRNVDRERAVTLTSARYFDDKGRLIKDFASGPKAVGPLGSIDFFVAESNAEGGSSASFVVEWVAETPVSDPMVEAIMIGMRNQQGVSFTSTGRVVHSRSKAESATQDLAPKPVASP